MVGTDVVDEDVDVVVLVVVVVEDEEGDELEEEELLLKMALDEWEGEKLELEEELEELEEDTDVAETDEMEELLVWRRWRTGYRCACATLARTRRVQRKERSVEPPIGNGNPSDEGWEEGKGLMYQV